MGQHNKHLSLALLLTSALLSTAASAQEEGATPTSPASPKDGGRFRRRFA